MGVEWVPRFLNQRPIVVTGGCGRDPTPFQTGNGSYTMKWTLTDTLVLTIGVPALFSILLWL